MGIMDRIKRKRSDMEKRKVKRDKATLKKLEKQQKMEETRLQIRKKKRILKEMNQKERGGGGRISGILQDIGKSVNNAEFGLLFDESLDNDEKKRRRKEQDDLF